MAQALGQQRHQVVAHDRLLLEEVGLASKASAWLEASREPRMHELLVQARQLAASHSPALILGETGVGKEVLAQAMHGWSARADQPFVKLNCSAIPEARPTLKAGRAPAFVLE